jgi:hypothetical protein
VVWAYGAAMTVKVTRTSAAERVLKRIELVRMHRKIGEIRSL